MAFKFSALKVEQFSHLFGLDSDVLARQGVRRVTVDSTPGFPCRVSLQDADIGESVLLMNYEHQSASTPFRSSHAIFVREGARQATPDRNEIPAMFRHRLLSVRAFDANGLMLDADIIGGEHLDSLIEKMFANAPVNYLHVHNAKPGCYAALVRRD